MSYDYLPGDTSVEKALNAIGINHAYAYRNINIPVPDWATPTGPTPMRIAARERIRQRAEAGDYDAKDLLALDVQEEGKGRYKRRQKP